MLRPLLKSIAAEFSGPVAWQHVAAIASFHRIQASPGYREAAHYTAKAFRDAGLTAEIFSYPADSRTNFWSQRMFQEWHCAGAEFHLLSPQRRRLADFASDPFSLIQRSAPTPPGGLEAELVLLENGEDPNAYAETPVDGKIVFARGDVERVRELAVEKHGAVGIVTDQVRELPGFRHPMDIPDARQYTSFWWDGGERQCFGFVLSPKAGEALRQVLQQAGDKGEPVRVQARVDSSFRDGAVEIVSAFLPGETEEEILLTAHLCHPRASANDNASGCGTLIEAARTLKRLLTDGTIPPLRRGIRFLLLPEMTGTYAYLAGRSGELSRLVAGLNLDMVGEKQELCGGPFLVEKPPRSVPNFAGDLAAAILGELGREFANLGGTAAYALFKHAVVPFSGGSDHAILSDPAVNIPSPMLIQWPDLYYHTSLDTIDKVDPAALRRAGILAATYAAFLAAAGGAAAVWLGAAMTAGFAGELHSVLTERSHPAHLPPAVRDELISFCRERKEADLLSLSRLLDDRDRAGFDRVLPELLEQLRAAAAAESRRWKLLGLAGPAPAPSPWEAEAAAIVPARTYPGPISTRGHLSVLSAAEREELRGIMQTENAPSYLEHAVYWMDGKRSLREIARCVRLETGREHGALLIPYTRLLARMGLVQLASAAGV